MFENLLFKHNLYKHNSNALCLFKSKHDYSAPDMYAKLYHYTLVVVPSNTISDSDDYY
jgi:hypothetical protein